MRRKTTAPLSLQRLAPEEWRHDRPAYAGDEYMDWESKPEPPREPNLQRLVTQGAAGASRS